MNGVWVQPYRAKKSHFFSLGVSLCRKYERDPGAGGYSTPGLHPCLECQRRLELVRKMEQGA